MVLVISLWDCLGVAWGSLRTRELWRNSGGFLSKEGEKGKSFSWGMGVFDTVGIVVKGERCERLCGDCRWFGVA